MEPRDKRLQVVAAQLEPLVESVAVRGKDAAEFLLVEAHGRACEVSVDDASFWVEFWEASADEDAPPVREATLRSAGEVIASVIQWLNERQRPFPG